MPYLDPLHSDARPSPRFPALSVFKLRSGAGSASLDTAPPPPPPKDPSHIPSPSPSLGAPPLAFYKTLFSRSAASLAPSLSPESNSGPVTPSTPYLPIPSACFEFGKRSNVALPIASTRAAATSPAPSASAGSVGSFSRGGRDYLPSPSMDGSTDSSGSCPNGSTRPNASPLNGASPNAYTAGQTTPASAKSKMGVFKLASLAKRNRSKKDLSDTASTSGSASRSASVSEYEAKVEGDEGISLPWNFQHNIHVDEGYIGLPPSWSAALSQVGFDQDEIALIHARRRAAASAVVPSIQPQNSAERPTSPQVLTVEPPTPSASSYTTLLAPFPRSSSLGKGGTILRIQPPSVYSATGTEGDPPGTAMSVSPARSPRARSIKSFVSTVKSSLTGDSASTRGGASRHPSEESEPYVFVGGDGPEEDTLAETYPFDTSSVSSRQTRPSTIRSMSRGQETPRTPTFGHVRASDAPSQSLSVPRSAHSRSPSPSRSRPGPSPRRMYHVANASAESSDDERYDDEPPPAYFSPKRAEWTPRNEKASPPGRSDPSAPTAGIHGLLLGADPEASMPENGDDTTDAVAGMSGDVLDISSTFAVRGDRELSPTPPPVLPPRISLHQDSLEDWSESLFSAIDSNGMRASVLPVLALEHGDEDGPGDDSTDPPPETDPGPPAPEAQRRASIDSLPPIPPPKTKHKHKPAPLALLPTTILHPRTNVITGLTRKSPVNALFGAKPQPLPVPIPPSQIRAQLRPAPPKPPHPPPTLPLPPLRRGPNVPPSLPSPQKASVTTPHASPPDTRPSSSQISLPARANQGGRDSDLSTITVTPATIATAKTEVVRTAIASVFDPDIVSLASARESVVSLSSNQPHTPNEPTTGKESPRPGQVPCESMVSEASSPSLLRNGSQSKWPAPPPPPIEIEAEMTPRRVSRFRTTSLGRVNHLQAMGSAASTPIGSHFPHGGSDTAPNSPSESGPLATPKGVNGVFPSTAPKAKSSLAVEARMLTSTTGTFGGVDVEGENGQGNEACSYPSEAPSSESHAPILPCTHPLLSQLQPYITPRPPVSYFADLVEIAEGESGSVFAARVVSCEHTRSHEGRQEGAEKPIPLGTSHVAIKRIPLPPAASSPSLSDDSPISNKLVSVLHELCLLKDLDHEHLLLLDGVYVCSGPPGDEDTETASTIDMSLWIRMELMERSLADVIGLVTEGLVLQERLVGRFASDVLHGLDYLQRQHIAHRDVRSDNLLVNAAGVVKLADFSNAICVDRNAPIVSGAVGVIYWQAPEMRTGPYNALKVDIWSLGATVWELAETVPPFSMPASPSTPVSFAVQSARHVGSQWPPLTHPEHYSRAFHEFLKLCGKESAGRPGPGELLNTSFIRNACGRAVILQLLAQCRTIEESMTAKEAGAGRSR